MRQHRFVDGPDEIDAALGLQKYDPSQPRDQDGKWSSGDADAAAALHAARGKIVLYHGTAKSAIKSIMADGLIPHRGKGGDALAAEENPHGNIATQAMIGGRASSVYVTPKPGAAVMFALIAAKMNHSTPAMVKVSIPKGEAAHLVEDEQFAHDEDGSAVGWRFEGNIKPEWIKPLKPSEVANLLDREADGLLKSGDGPTVFYVVIPCDGAGATTSFTETLKAFDPDQPRDEDGRWTADGGGAAGEDHHPAGVAFASPSITDKELPEALQALHGARQRAFEQASSDIDAGLGLTGRQFGVVGAWADGAENSTMLETRDVDPQALRLSAAMKGSLGAQKAVLVFTSAQDGPSALYDMTVHGSVPETHAALLKAGVPFHTLVPTNTGTRVLVVDTDGSLGQSVGDFAGARHTFATRTNGHAEFIGDDQGTGSDAEQRERARLAYEKVISASDAPTYRGRTAGELWQGVRDRWSERIAVLKVRVLGFADALAAVEKFDPDQPRDDAGRWTGDGGEPGMGPSMAESIDEDVAYERMAAALYARHDVKVTAAQLADVMARAAKKSA